jgi:hypothetical protein
LLIEIVGVSVVYDAKRSWKSCCVADEFDLTRRTEFRATSSRQSNFASRFPQRAVSKKKQKEGTRSASAIGIRDRYERIH